jgi:glycosyltransferase involved in cell wall biosynthesis
MVLHQFYPEFCGGTEKVSLQLAKMAQRAGHYVHVLACTVSPLKGGGRQSEILPTALQTVYEGVPVTLLQRDWLPDTADIGFATDAPLVVQLSAWIDKERFDVAHVLHAMRMGSALLAIQRSRLPYLLTLTDFFLPCFLINLVYLDNQLCKGPEQGMRCVKDCLVGPWTEASLKGRFQQSRDLLKCAGTRVCPSEYVARRFRENYPDLKFRVIPHGLDFKILVGVTTAAPVAAKKGLNFGYVGTIVPQKGPDNLLRAFAKVADPTARLRVAGGFYGDPAHHHEVKRLAEADSRVELLGQVAPAGVFELLQSLDILCLPSRVPESFSLILQEAVAAGVPALVSDLGAPAERITANGGGRVLATDDVDAWADAMAQLVEHPGQVAAWSEELQLPLRIEEESFYYESFYRRIARQES